MTGEVDDYEPIGLIRIVATCKEAFDYGENPGTGYQCASDAVKAWNYSFGVNSKDEAWKLA